MEPISSYTPSDRIQQIFNIQQIDSLKPLSKQDRVVAICHVYQQLIALENRRKDNPISLTVEQKLNYIRYTDGSITNITMPKRYDYSTSFSIESYQEESKKLTKQLAELDTERFVESLGDDSEILDQIESLFSEWSELAQKNTESMNLLFKRCNELKTADEKEELELAQKNMESLDIFFKYTDELKATS
jgi:hypothetical protein